MKIAFQGVRGANSEVGIRQHYGADAEPIGFDFSEQVLASVLSAQAQAGFIPVENPIAGNMAPHLELLCCHPVTVIAESVDFMGSLQDDAVQHCLMSMSDPTYLIKVLGSYPVAVPVRAEAV